MMKKFFASLLTLMLVSPAFAVSVEHININEKAPNNEVRISTAETTILEGNVLAVGFDELFDSKKHQAGDVVSFSNENAIYTVEGTLVIPAKSTFEGTIIDLKQPKWFNKNARVFMLVNKLTTPDGKSFNINAKPFYKDYALKESAWKNVGRAALSTVTLGAIGTGIGIGFGFIPNPAKIGTGIAAGVSTGAGLGLLYGLVAKGLNYKAKAGEQIFVILLDDATMSK